MFISHVPSRVRIDNRSIEILMVISNKSKHEFFVYISD